jgi:hypothetical protein
VSAGKRRTACVMRRAFGLSLHLVRRDSARDNGSAGGRKALSPHGPAVGARSAAGVMGARGPVALRHGYWGGPAVAFGATVAVAGAIVLTGEF